jgi:hypothetical protein
MPKFMLILHDDMTNLTKLAPGEMQRLIVQYKAWSAKMAQAGKLAGGEKLRDEGGKHLSAKGGKMVVLCAECPHLAIGGRIELREIEAM